jgi:hypothetical protein
MSQTYKILGQIQPSVNTATNVYSSGVNSAVIQSIYICKQDSANANVDIIVRPVGTALGNQHYILQNQLVGAADTIVLNLNITMNSSVVLVANNRYKAGESKAANVSFSAFGVEIQ